MYSVKNETSKCTRSSVINLGHLHLKVGQVRVKKLVRRNDRKTLFCLSLSLFIKAWTVKQPGLNLIISLQ